MWALQEVRPTWWGWGKQMTSPARGPEGHQLHVQQHFSSKGRSSSSKSVLRRSPQWWMPHSDEWGVWLNPGKNLEACGHFRWFLASSFQFLSPYHHYLSLLSPCFCLKRLSLEVRVTTIHVAMRNFGKQVSMSHHSHPANCLGPTPVCLQG